MGWRGNVFWQPVACCTRHHNVKRTIYEKSNDQTIFKILESTLCQLIIRKKSVADFVHAPLWYSSFVFRPSSDMWWIMDVIIFAQVKNAYCNYPKPNGSLFNEWLRKTLIILTFNVQLANIWPFSSTRSEDTWNHALSFISLVRSSGSWKT